MKAFDPDGSYFALTLGADRRGKPFWSGQSRWIGWPERNPHWEIRVASLVHPRRMTEMWAIVGQAWVSVHDGESLSVFLRIGGHALVEKTVAETHLPSAIAPMECVHDGAITAGGCGFVVTNHLPDTAVQRRAPERKLRIAVLNAMGIAVSCAGVGPPTTSTSNSTCTMSSPAACTDPPPRRTSSPSAAHATKGSTRISSPP